MTIELYGHRNSSTILSGVQSLFEDGSWPIALIVFLASVLIPLLKLIALFYLGLTARNSKHARFKTKLYRVVETVGRWSMLDIFSARGLSRHHETGTLDSSRTRSRFAPIFTRRDFYNGGLGSI